MSRAISQDVADASRTAPAQRARRGHGAARRRRLAGVVVYGVAIMMVAFALIGPVFVPHAPGRIIAAPYTAPAPGRLLGTDHLGRDVWSRVLAGGRPLILLPLVATALTCALGAAIGATSGYLGGRVGAVITWLTRLLLVLPATLVLLVVLDGWGYSDTTLVVAVALTGAPFVARLAHAATLRAARSGCVERAAGLGESTSSILLREIAPMIAGPLLADAGMRLVTAIDLVATAGFLGFGPDTPNWASMINQNRDGLTLTPWSVAAPTLALGLLAVSVNLAMDRLTRPLIR